MALEGVPALISINVEALQGAEKVQATATAISGNVLDVAAGSDGLIISVDNIHVPGSTTNKRSEQVRPQFAQPGVRMQLTSRRKQRRRRGCCGRTARLRCRGTNSWGGRISWTQRRQATVPVWASCCTGSRICASVEGVVTSDYRDKGGWNGLSKTEQGHGQ